MKKIIGRSEKFLLLELGQTEVQSKIDTGAFSNALHVDDINLNGDKLDIKIKDKTFSFKDWKTVEVKNSFGQVEKRFSILTRIKLGNRKYKTYICLTKRHTMKYKMLIGRKFLYKFGYVVDVTQKNTYDTIKEV